MNEKIKYWIEKLEKQGKLKVYDNQNSQIWKDGAADYFIDNYQYINHFNYMMVYNKLR